MMSGRQMAKTYDPAMVEQRIYQWWEQSGYFTPAIDRAKDPFVISMPPPNVTGVLHLGHAITASLQDLMIRYHRMRGEPTLWLPGEDHASIAAQYVVEKEIANEGLTREGLGREAFLDRVWDWMRRYRHVIAMQHRSLGTSCDWTRERFTMDEGMARAVREAFVRLYRDGLIYRGAYLINWCPRCGTALSDLEVEHEEQESRLYYVRYPLAESADESITVATTRPETILGDTAVAVNPADERFSSLLGREAILPVLHRSIPIIADETVDPAFGTGAVKVTPGHDPTDYDVGQRHGLPIINIMNEDGTLNEQAGPYAGQDRFEARQNLVRDLDQAGLLTKTEPYHHALGHCQRCNAVVEPRVSTQWFVRIKPLAEPAMEAARDGRICFVPERFAKVYFNWMENIRDWCISRQLWWGHRIPVWYCDDCGYMSVSTEETLAVCTRCGSALVHQDPDVLDTWFSSGLWPFSTLGWPDDTEDLEYFYPTDVMETAYDILFFWVARMIMLGMRMTGEVPFHTVYLHGLIRDAEGQKMSKSKGNVVDPLEVIAEYGADALRFALLTGSTPGNDMKLSVQKVEGARNFCNKLWNAARFVVGNLAEKQPMDFDRLAAMATSETSRASLADRWILSRLSSVVQEATRLIDQYQFGEAGRQLYDFIWGDYCDWYIEMSKVTLYGEDAASKEYALSVLVYALEQSLRMLHPFTPFVTEETWQQLPHAGEALIVAPWPHQGRRDEAAEADMQLLMDVVGGIRNARSEYEVEPGKAISATIIAGPKAEMFRSQANIVVRLANIDPGRLLVAEQVQDRPTKALTFVVGNCEVYLPLAGLVEVDREVQRLAGVLEATNGEIERSQKLLANSGFVSKAPPAVVGRERDKLAELLLRQAKIEERLTTLRD